MKKLLIDVWAELIVEKKNIVHQNGIGRKGHEKWII